MNKELKTLYIKYSDLHKEGKISLQTLLKKAYKLGQNTANKNIFIFADSPVTFEAITGCDITMQRETDFYGAIQKIKFLTFKEK